MKNFLVPVLVILTILSVSNASAQIMWNTKGIETIQSKKLVVIIAKPHSKAMSKLPLSEVEKVQALYDQFNARLKQQITSVWKLHKDVVFKTSAEFWEMPLKERKEYVVLSYQSASTGSSFGGFIYDGYLDMSPKYEAKEKEGPNFAYLFQNLFISEGQGISKTLFLFPLPELNLGPRSLHFSLYTTQAYFKRRLNNEKVYTDDLISDAEATVQAAPLKEKTLLINADEIASSFTLVDIKKIYPYKVEVVSREEIEKRIEAEDAGYAYYMVQPQVVSQRSSNLTLGGMSYARYLHLFVDIQSGDLLAEYMVKPNSFVSNESLQKLTEKTLGKLLDSFVGK